MKKSVFLVAMFFGALNLHAQNVDFGQIVAGSQADANKYLTSYLEPFAKGEIFNTGRGWFTSAKVHKTLGFDLSVSAQLAIVPEINKNFIFDSHQYESFRLKSGNATASLPTFMGGNTNEVITVEKSFDTTISGVSTKFPIKYEFNAANGIADSATQLPLLNSNIPVPLPVFQLGLGLFAHTEVKVRYLPEQELNGTKIKLFGIAVQHEFGKDIPVIKRIPFLHLSALAGYNTINTSYNLNDKSVSGSNQTSEINFNSFTLQAIASVKFSLLEIYSSLGYTSGNADISLKGDYTIDYTTSDGSIYRKNFHDPIALAYSTSSVSNTTGIRLNLLFLKVFADYTFAKYNGIGAGVSFSIR